LKRKIEEKLRAIELRKEGHSLNEIVAMLDIVKSTASVWVRNVPLSVTARRILTSKVGEGRMRGGDTRRRMNTEAKNLARIEARSMIASLPSHRGLDKLMCGLLYYCEGAKDTSSGIRFTNSSPSLMAKFIDLFQKSFIIERQRVRMGLHLHGYHDQVVQRAYWSKITKIPKNQFIRPYLKPNTGKRIHPDYPGCATFYYSSAQIARELIAVAEEFLKMKGA
jgi:hypothetical protein